jgi:hypothetical protein
MGKYTLVVFSNPTEGREDEYNKWYTNEHLADVVNIPGFCSAQRFKLLTLLKGDLKHGYLALYDMDAETREQADAAVKALVTTPMEVSGSLDADGVQGGVFEMCGPEVSSKSGAATGKCRLVVLTSAVTGRDDEFNTWYNTTHFGEMMAAPGFTSGERYKEYSPLAAPFRNPYLSVYGMEADSMEGAGAALGALATAGMTLSEASDNTDSIISVFEVISDKVLAPKEKALA